MNFNDTNVVLNHHLTYFLKVIVNKRGSIATLPLFNFFNLDSTDFFLPVVPDHYAD